MRGQTTPKVIQARQWVDEGRAGMAKPARVQAARGRHANGSRDKNRLINLRGKEQIALDAPQV